MDQAPEGSSDCHNPCLCERWRFRRDEQSNHDTETKEKEEGSVWDPGSAEH